MKAIQITFKETPITVYVTHDNKNGPLCVTHSNLTHDLLIENYEVVITIAPPSIYYRGPYRPEHNYQHHWHLMKTGVIIFEQPK